MVVTTAVLNNGTETRLMQVLNMLDVVVTFAVLSSGTLVNE